MQNLLIRQQNCCVHWCSRLKPHDQNIISFPLAPLDLPESNCFCLLQKDAFRDLKIIWPCKIRQAYALQLKKIPYQREAIIRPIVPLPTD
tara:strand:- start:172 stop:441 length:270 start_codon:yes stop_codon:yes gene_type:complete